MALVTTPGAADANSYATVLEAEAHIATLTFAKGWPTSNDGIEAVLRQAFTKINTLSLKGTRAASEEDQAGAFPRVGLYDRDGFAIASNVVPRAVKAAQIDLALWLGQKNRNADAAPARVKIGGLEIEGQAASASFPPHVLAMLAPFLNSYGSCIKLERA